MESLEQQFRSSYLKPADGNNADPLTSTPEEIQQTIATLNVTLARCRLPELTDDQRALMAGQLTQEHRDILVTLVDTFASDPALCRAAGFGPEIFSSILDADVELESLGAVLDQLVQRLIAAGEKQDAALLLMNSTTLLDVQAQASAAPDGEREELEALFIAALRQQSALSARPETGKRSPAAPASLRALRDHVEGAQADAEVRRAVATIQASAERLPTPSLPPSRRRG